MWCPCLTETEEHSERSCTVTWQMMTSLFRFGQSNGATARLGGFGLSALGGPYQYTVIAGGRGGNYAAKISFPGYIHLGHVANTHGLPEEGCFAPTPHPPQQHRL